MIDSIIESDDIPRNIHCRNFLQDTIFKLNKIKTELRGWKKRVKDNDTEFSSKKYRELVKKKTMFLVQLSTIKEITYKIRYINLLNLDSGMFEIVFFLNEKVIHIAHLKVLQIVHFISDKTKLRDEIAPIVIDKIAHKKLLDKVNVL